MTDRLNASQCDPREVLQVHICLNFYACQVVTYIARKAREKENTANRG